MRLLIACDMEGITGVTRWEHCDTNHAEYQRFRKLMTDDVNAVIEGAFSGGAEEIFIADGHSRGQNLLIEDLDKRVEYNNGTFSPWSMMNGIDNGINAVMLVGYHAKAGTGDAILAHTWSKEVLDLKINQQSNGELGLNAMIAGYFGAPVIMASGDQTLAKEAALLIPGIEIAVVKQASGYFSGCCLPPAQTHDLLLKTAKKAVKSYLAGDGPKPLMAANPIDIEVEFHMPHMAEAAARIPGAERRSGRAAGMVCGNVPDAFAAFRTMCNLI
ncbi:MAG: M55 family metallopeptidase [Flexilinea sp.]